MQRRATLADEQLIKELPQHIKEAIFRYIRTQLSYTLTEDDLHSFISKLK